MSFNLLCEIISWICLASQHSKTDNMSRIRLTLSLEDLLLLQLNDQQVK